MPRLACVVLALFAAVSAHAQPAAVPATETLHAPNAQRVAQVLAAAKRDGWAPQVGPLREAARQAYRTAPLTTAEAWLHLYAWAALFGQTEAEYAPQWVAAVNRARVGHANMPQQIPQRAVPLGAAVSPEFQAWAIGKREFSAAFWATVTPVDYLPQVLAILDGFSREQRARLEGYPQLALAIAVVLDVPPPPYWPHGQVPADVLPRRFIEPRDTFAWWVKQDQGGRLAHSPKTLRVEELKFLVDAAAPFAEREWAQAAVAVPLEEFPKVYDLVKYRMDRVTANQPMWPGRSYRLADVLAAGGICADQAYFASEVGKARGVPTLLFHGAGNDGRHAWFGYLDRRKTWQLDAGRYAEQRFVTGHAFDPQTWRLITDHELQFLREGFRAQNSYRMSRIHERFAADFLASGELPEAQAAARKSVQFERRNQEGWELLVAALLKSGDAKRAEVALREAALAFQRFPDLEAYYVNRLAESLRARGQTSEAQAELQRISRKNVDARVDIALQQAKERLNRTLRSEPLPAQLRAYNQALDSLGAGAGIGLFDEIVAPFVEHLLRLGNRVEAAKSLERAYGVMRVQPDTQLESEFKQLRLKVSGPGAARS